MFQVASPVGYTKELYKGLSIPRALQNIDRISTENKEQVRAIAEEIKKRCHTLEEICIAIWYAIRDNTTYTRDSADGKTEVLRTPARMFADKEGDCDCFTIGASAILKCLAIPHFYNVVAYDKPSAWQHIYPVILCKCGDRYVIDCVPEIHYHLEELPYINHRTPIYEATMSYKTIELGSANRYTEAQNFQNFTDLQIASEQIVEPYLLNAKGNAQTLAIIQTELLQVQPTTNNPNAVRYELDVVNNLIAIDVLDSEKLAKGLSYALQLDKPSSFAPIYAYILRVLQENNTGRMTFAEYLEKMQKLAPTDEGQEMGFIGAIVGATTQIVGTFKAANEAKKDRAFQENMANKTAEQTAKAHEMEMQRLAKQEQIAQVQAQQAQYANAKNEQANTTTKPNWLMQNWWVIAIIVVVGVGIFIFVMKSNNAKNEMQGAKRKRRQKRQHQLSGAKSGRKPSAKRKRKRTALAGTTPTPRRRRRSQLSGAPRRQGGRKTSNKRTMGSAKSRFVRSRTTTRRR